MTEGNAEPVPVQLTRMEGTINLIAYQVGDLASRMDRIERRVNDVEIHQATGDGASGSFLRWVPVIIAGIGVLAALGLGFRFGG